MRRTSSALTTTILGAAIAASTVSAQQFLPSVGGRRASSAASAPASESTPASVSPSAGDVTAGADPSADPIIGMAATRGARFLLRNGVDYIGFQEYERALKYLREAETRQKELNNSERLALKQAIEKAQRGLREATGQSPYALSRRPTRAGGFAVAKPETQLASTGARRPQLPADDSATRAVRARPSEPPAVQAEDQGEPIRLTGAEIPLSDARATPPAHEAEATGNPDPAEMPQPLPIAAEAPATLPDIRAIQEQSSEAATFGGITKPPSAAPEAPAADTAPVSLDPSASPAAAPEETRAPEPVSLPPQEADAPAVGTLAPPLFSSRKPAPTAAPVADPGVKPAADQVESFGRVEPAAEPTPAAPTPPAAEPTQATPALEPTSATATAPAEEAAKDELPPLPPLGAEEKPATPRGEDVRPEMPEAMPPAVAAASEELPPLPRQGASEEASKAEPLAPAAEEFPQLPANDPPAVQEGPALDAVPSQPAAEPAPSRAPALNPTANAAMPEEDKGPTIEEVPAPGASPEDPPAAIPAPAAEPTPAASAEATPEVPAAPAEAPTPVAAEAPAPVAAEARGDVLPVAPPSSAATEGEAPAPAPAPAAAEAPQGASDDLPALPQPPAGRLYAPPTSSGSDSFFPRPVMAPSTLRPEQQRLVEEVARRQEEELRRNPTNPEAPAAAAPPAPGEGEMLPERRSTTATQVDISRAPSPAEARPIRAIPVPDDWVPMNTRDWTPQRKYWAAAATCHLPLYFQDPMLERYGHSVEQYFGPAGRYMAYPVDRHTQSTQRNQIAQPFFSAGLFAWQIITWPYALVMDPPWEAQYDLGYWRPGDKIPTDMYYQPLHGTGAPLKGRKY